MFHYATIVTYNRTIPSVSSYTQPLCYFSECELELSDVLKRIMELAEKEKSGGFEIAGISVPIVFSVDPSDYYAAIKQRIICHDELDYHIEFLIIFNNLEGDELNNFFEYIYTLNSAYDR